MSISIETDAEDRSMRHTDDKDIVMLTTTDNPFSPKVDYDKWKQYDEDNKHYTAEYLARIVDLPNDADLEDDQLIEELTLNAIEEIVEHDVLGIYKKI